MAELKIKVSYKGFDLEMDGDAETTKSIFENVKSDILEKLAIEPEKVTHTESNNTDFELPDNTPTKSISTVVPSKKAKNTNSKLEHYELVILAIEKAKHREFIEEYRSYGVNGGFNSVVVLFYIYSKITGVTEFDLNTTYSLLKTVGEKIPKVLSQTLRDIKSKKNYIDRNSNGTYSLTHLGDNFVEIELTKKQEAK